MNRLTLGLTLFVAISLSGCAAPSQYYWGDYSNTLYHFKKTPSDESLLKHQQVLENIIEESKKRNLVVPPGVYAELGYIYLKQNKNPLAIQYFKMEKEIYPESALLMHRLENVALIKEKKPEDKTATTAQPEIKPEKSEKQLK
jgi:hypothetical protein